MTAAAGKGRDLVVYSRQGCHLCEIMIEELLPLARGRARVRVRDVDTRDDWRELYGRRVPVLEYDGLSLCEYRLDHGAVRELLDRAER
jgi:hypothetical protein